MNVAAGTRLRRAIGMGSVAVLLSLDVYATGLLGGGERTLAVVRSIVLPGLPFLEWQLWLGLLFIATTLAAVGAWLRWGTDWLPLLVMAGAVAVAAFVMPLHHAESAAPHPPAHHGHAHDHQAAMPPSWPPVALHDERRYWIGASHEFTVVLVVFALLARVRLLFARAPGAHWLRSRLPTGLLFPAVDLARAATLSLLAGGERDAARATLREPQLLARAAQINRWARFRRRGDPLRGAHAPLRAALAASGLLDDTQLADLRRESRASLAGVPTSEPTWVRPLDGMLAACVLAELGESECVARWRAAFAERFALRHGRRPAALHTPSMLAIGTARDWEHAAATALGYRMGWTGSDDWTHLRPRCLGRAASGAHDPESLRLVAAGTLWAHLLDDAEAAEILGRRTLAGDPMAAALQALGARGRMGRA